MRWKYFKRNPNISILEYRGPRDILLKRFEIFPTSYLLTVYKCHMILSKNNFNCVYKYVNLLSVNINVKNVACLQI